MSSPFVAEIRIFACNFPPTGWAFCDGQIMSISQNTALFSLLGTTYGGNGKSSFALPDLEGAVPIHTGGSQPGPGLSFYDLGQTGGAPTVTLIESEMPSHSHTLMATTQGANQATPVGNSLARTTGTFKPYLAPAGAPLVQMSQNALPPAGGDMPHNNMMPFLTLNFCIALQGVYPPRP